ncbi:MAG: methylated-DNA--[protein]-cysteine S-methyltransferase [Pseudomonadota bacterium]
MSEKKDLKIHTFITPIGMMAIFFDPYSGLVKRILLPQNKGLDLERAVIKESSDRPIFVSQLIQQIEEYFQGSAIRFYEEMFDLNGVTSLEKNAFLATTEIPFGSVSSYKKIAEIIGCPNGARFVGSVMAKNPFPIIIPCHRVIRSDGNLGGYGGGLGLKKRLLEWEASELGRRLLRRNG